MYIRDRVKLNTDLYNNNKTCKKCNTNQELIHFYFHKRANLYNANCKKCERQKRKPNPNPIYYHLSNIEKDFIIEMFAKERNIDKIAKKLNRSVYTISLFLVKKQLHKVVKRTYTNNTKENALHRDQLRQNKEVRRWKLNVCKRDNFICQKCQTSLGELNAHHLNGFHWDIDNRLNINNGVTLCKKCHIEFHVKYGKFNNTVIQYNTWNVNNQINDEFLLESVKKQLRSG